MTPDLQTQLDQITNQLVHERYVIFPPPKPDTPPPQEEEEAQEGEGQKEFGEGEGGEQEGGDTQDSSRSGHLSRIAEESETDGTKVEDTVSETDKS